MQFYDFQKLAFKLICKKFLCNQRFYVRNGNNIRKNFNIPYQFS